MTISSIEVVVYTAYFVLPGYVIYGIVNSFVPMQIRSDAEKVLRFILYSLIELALWFWWLGRIGDADKSTYWIKLLAVVLFTSIITGAVIGIFLKWNPCGRLLRRLKVQVISKVPSAWDYKFSNLKEGRRLTVALNDGTFIRGIYYSRSMASCDDGYKDIYLEESWQLDGDGNWVRVKDTDGVWISPGAIKWISFKEGEADAEK
ncbi:DUF6338 family protein [Butyrivibrio fibrisolvens]|uniref:DUF6338 family protein n=1 Tax=Butyrivibrio fibrisolvens TaxID=831 RepID=UPI0003FA7B4F|nr:DUF6338 family protein [Butyrivibrio fibrisolvens]